MNFNKKKFKFTDLSDDNTFDVSQKENDNLINNTKLDLDFNFSKQHVSQKNVVVNNPNVIPIYKKESPINETSLENLNNNQNTYNNEEIVEVKKTIDVLEKNSDYIKTNFVDENKKNSQEFKTFNQIINSTDVKNESNLNNEKITDNFNVKEKLDVKTNIYLKQNLVFQIQEISKKTGESRSSVINRLIEIALKKMI